jgi:hypothetical protein
VSWVAMYAAASCSYNKRRFIDAAFRLTDSKYYIPF